MKLVSYVGAGTDSWGVLTDLGVLNVINAAKKFEFTGIQFESVLEVIKGGKTSLAEIQKVIDKADSAGDESLYAPMYKVDLLAPVPVPESIRDYGLFEKHIIEMIRSVGLGRLASLDRKLEKLLNGKSVAKKINKAWYQRPAFYKGNRFSVVGHKTQIIIPYDCKAFDFELEFGVFLCGLGKNIKAENARDHMFGITLFNDFSARDIQMSEMKARMGPAKGKDFDTGYAMGPYLLTMDEVDDINNLDFEVYLNGKLFGGGNSSESNWTFEEVIEFTSRNETLRPGEFLGSGTISGNKGSGCGAEIKRFLKPGDVVELRSPELGSLVNTIG